MCNVTVLFGDRYYVAMSALVAMAPVLLYIVVFAYQITQRMHLHLHLLQTQYATVAVVHPQ